MIALRAFAVAALALVVVPFAVGCSADSSGSDEVVPGDDGTTGGSEDEVRSTLLGNVAAIKINGGPTVAAPAKVKRILENIGLQPGAARPGEGGFRCPPSYRLEILKSNGEVAATAGFLCGGSGSASRKDAKGSVQVGGKSYLIDAKDVDALDAIGKEPLAVGDILFGVDRVTITKPGQQAGQVETRDGAMVAKVVKAMKADQAPNPNASFPRCLPSRSVGLHKGTKLMASVSLNCGEGARGVVQGAFSVAEPRLYGAVDINAGTVFDIERSLIGGAQP